MLRIENLYKFVLFFLTSYFLLWGAHQTDPVKNAHVHFFNTVEQFTFNLLNPRFKTDFTIYTATEGVPYYPEAYDYSLYIYDKKQLRRARNKKRVGPLTMLNAGLDKTSIGPIILFLAFLIATPLHWRRKLICAVIGTFIIYALLALKFSYMIDSNMPNIDVGGLWGMLSNLFGKAFRSYEFMLTIVLFVWAIVCLRRKELKWFLDRTKYPLHTLRHTLGKNTVKY